MEKNPEYITRKYLRDIILNFLIAGKDTTAGTLSWFIYVLCKYPLVQEKVALEVKNAIEVDEDISFIQYYANLLTDEVINKMQYLHAALAETLRLYPAVPMDSKVCFSNDTLPDGFDTTKGDVITYLPYAMGRMKYLRGEDAESFRPERWINENGSFQSESPFKFTAFQAEVEVERLDKLKASKMKEIALKKRTEFEDIFARAHIDIDSVAFSYL